MSPPNPVIDQLVIQQAELSKLHSPGDFFAWQDTLAINWDDDRPCVRVCDGTGCRALGSQQVLQGLRQEIRKASLEVPVEVVGTGCPGFCECGPLLTI